MACLIIGPVNARDRLLNGRTGLSKVLGRIVTANKFTHTELKSFHDWSNPGCESWISTSQMSSIRNCKLGAPGPKVLDALANINLRLASYTCELGEESGLVEVEPDSNFESKFHIQVPVFVTHPTSQLPLNAGDIFMIFMGHLDPGVTSACYSDKQAAMVCTRIAFYIQCWMLEKRLTPTAAKPQLINKYSGSNERAEKFFVMAMGGQPLTGEELSKAEDEIDEIHMLVLGTYRTKESWQQFISTGICEDGEKLLRFKE